MALLDRTLQLGPVAIATGQPEWVATDPAYRRRGLVAAQFAVAHARSAERGHLVQIVTGIPYFYRRLGSGYAADRPARYRLRPSGPDAPDGWRVERATAEDLEAVIRLDDDARAAVDLTFDRSPADWAWLVEHAER